VFFKILNKINIFVKNVGKFFKISLENRLNFKTKLPRSGWQENSQFSSS